MFFCFKKINNQGTSLIEIIIALAIFSLVGATLATLSVGGLATLDTAGQETEAQALAQEGIEAVRAIRDRAWNELTFTTSTVATSSNQWVLSGEGTTSQIGNYFRTISFENVCRDGGNNITTCPGVYTDVHTKKIISQVDWWAHSVTNTVRQVGYLTNWDSNIWSQTDWVGGSGQNIWLDATRYLSDDGGLEVGTAGQVQLKYTSGSGCGPMIWDFNSASQYTYDPAKIEVVGGFGQLKDNGSCSGTTSTCATLLSQTSCQAQAGCSWTGSFDSGKPTINNANSYTPNQIDSWTGFVETATKNGGEIYYQLSNDNGVSWKYWTGATWATSTLATHYNISTEINANISTFPTSSKKIMFKAFLSGNGSQQVKLDQVQVNCARKNNWDFGLSSDYTFNSSFVEVTSSVAQLKNLGGASTCSGTATVCSAFVTSPTCAAQGGCSWAGASTASTTNPDFTTNATGWTYADWVDSNNKASGAWVGTGGNPTGNIQITTGGQKNLTISGYYYQSFTTTQNNSSGTLNYDWKVVTYNSQNLVSYRVYIFIDTTAGAPTIGTEVASSTIVGTTAWASRSINITSKLATAGTYYVKLAVQQVLNNLAGTPGTSVVGFDNARVFYTTPSVCSGTATACNTYVASSTCVAQGGCSWGGGGGTSFATTSPSINPTISFSVPTNTFYGWTDFFETVSTSGGSVSYQLSYNDGIAWLYWNGASWVGAGAGNYNSAAIIDANISTFNTSTGKLMFKAFLTSNGSQQVQLDTIAVMYMETLGTSGYATAGSLISSAFNMGNTSPLTVLAWNHNTSTCSNCTVKMQVRTAQDNAGTPGTWSAWYGDGGAGTYFTDYRGAMVPNVLNWNQWAQYQLFLTGDGNTTPIFNDVSLYYK